MANFDAKPLRFSALAFISASSLHHILPISGEEVAIKVQRPGIEPVIYRDLFLFRTLGGVFDKACDYITIVYQLLTEHTS